MTDLTHLLPEHQDDYSASVRHEIRLRRAGFEPAQGAYRVGYKMPEAVDPFSSLSLFDLYNLLDLEPDNPPTLLSEGAGVVRAVHTNFAEPDVPEFESADWNPFAMGGAWFVGMA